MTGLPFRLLTCLLLLSVMAGGLVARAAAGPAAPMALAAHPAQASAPDCHEKGAAGEHAAPAADPAPTHECCSAVDPGNGHDCGAGCACPPAAAAMVAVPPRDFAVAPQPVRPPGPARGDPGRATAPGHRPPIA